MDSTKIWLLFLGIVLLPGLSKANGDPYDDQDDCPRYTLEEFKVSVFHKLVGTELHLLRQTLLEGVDGVLELVEGTKERSPGGTHAVDADNVKNALLALKPQILQVFMQTFVNMETEWAKALAPDEDGSKQTLEELQKKFILLHAAIHGTHIALEEPFERLALAARAVMDPLIEILVMFLKQAQQTGQKTDEMLEKLQEKNKLLGLVLGELVKAKVEKTEIQPPDFMHRSNDFWSHFTILLFKEGINKSMKNDEEFWKVALEKMWDFPAYKYCQALGAVEDDEDDCEEKFKVNMLVSAIGTTEPDENFYKRDDDQGE